MNIVNNVFLALSGILIVASVLLPRFAFINSAISLKTAALLSGVGVGIGNGIFIFFSVGNRNLMDSIIVGIITSVVATVTCYFMFRRHRQ